ncbi:MAG: YgiT-type zinc finger protein [bacterium]
MSMYGYQCEFCDGTVKERVVKKEVFKHKTGFVMLEEVPIGICDRCGYRYYLSSLLRKVDEIGEGKCEPKRTEAIPVSHFE